MTPTVGSLIGGRYRLERPLASGAMGVVWVARHEHLGRRVALKLMSPATATSREGRARFEREARACAELDSPHVVRVFDYGLEGDAPYLAMELLEGEDLAQRLVRDRRISLPAAATVAVHIGRGLRRAHEAGLVHRDVKPQNIFLARVDGEEVAKLLDFGVAKVLDPGGDGDATQTGALLGSVHYMSPEQVRHSSQVDHRTDLWGLAAVLFRALTGRPPFAGQQLGDVIVRICTEPVPRVLDVAPELGPRVDAFFLRALAKAPEDRFQSARELADAFVEVVEGHGDPAPPIAPAIPSSSRAGAAATAPPATSAAPEATAAPTVVSGPIAHRAPASPVEATLALPEPGTVAGVFGSSRAPAAPRPTRRSVAFFAVAGAIALLTSAALVATGRLHPRDADSTPSTALAASPTTSTSTATDDRPSTTSPALPIAAPATTGEPPIPAASASSPPAPGASQRAPSTAPAKAKPPTKGRKVNPVLGF